MACVMTRRRVVGVGAALWGIASEALSPTPARVMSQLIDVHCHLTHRKFEADVDIVAERAAQFGLEYCVVNGLCPDSNRAVLQLCHRHDHLLPALGIYPLIAAANVITPEMWKDAPEGFAPPDKFDVDAEIDFIDQAAARGEMVAIGECGLDSYYVDNIVFLQEQERVLRLLLRVAKKHDLPVILHSRKAEARVFEILQEESIVKADFHCYGGKIKLGVKIAEAGYFLSIPSAVERADHFRQLAGRLPIESILTETDSPYMGPDKGVRNEPSTVTRGVEAIADARGIPAEEAAQAIRNNFLRLFGI